MTKTEELVLKIITLAKEFSDFPLNDGDTVEEAEEISKRKVSIKNEIQKLKGQLLFEQYLELQSKEFKEDILGYEKFKEPGKDIAIKVNFKWGWLRVYRNNDNQIEWY